MKIFRSAKIAIAALSTLGFAITASAQCPVSTGPTNNCSYGDALDVITIGGNTVSNAGCSGTGTGYTFFPTPIWQFTLGQSYSIALNVGGGTYEQGVGIWIDMNNDLQFDPSEFVWNSGTWALSHTGTLTIPAVGAAPDTVMMRIMCTYYTVPTASQACTSSIGSYGETEDYLVALIPSIFADDIEMASVVKPIDNTCGNPTDSLIVRVKNVGTNPTAAFQVDANLSGMLTGSYSANVINPIPAGDSVDVFITTLNTQAGGALTIDAYSTYAADMDNSNDTLNTTINLIDATDLVISGASTTACNGDSVTLTVNTSGTETYDWTENGGFLATADTVNPDGLTGNTQYIVTSSNTCRAADTLDITIIPAPTGSFTYSVNGGAVDFTGTATDYLDISWDFGDGTGTGTGLTPTYTYSQNGTYYVCMSINGTCDTVMYCDSVSTPNVGLSIYELGDVSVYPNPTTGKVTIGLNNLIGFNGTWSLINMDGRVLESSKLGITSNEQKIEVSLETCSPGTYIFRLTGEQGESYQVNLIRQ